MWGDSERDKELKARLDSQDEKLKKLDGLDKLDTVLSEFTEVKKRLDSIEAGGQNQETDEQRQQREQQEQQQQQQQQQSSQMTSFLVDENRAFAERAMPLAAMQLQTASKIAKMSTRNKIQLMQKEGDPYYGQRMARFFDKHETEIDKLASRVPLAQQGHDETWMNMFKLVQADHIDEISDKTTPFIEGGAGGITPASVDNNQQQDVLTDAQKRVAQRMGITEADYKESRKGLVYTS